MNVRVREFPGLVQVVKADPTEADVSAIQAATGIQVDPADIHVRRARVAHDQYDRTFERFPVDYLQRFAETLPGKSVLPGHDTSALPIGRWFDGMTQTHQEPFQSLVNPHPRKAAGTAVDPGSGEPGSIPGFEQKTKRVTWMKAGFYFPNDPGTELLRKNLDTGTYKDVSVGFKYDKIDCEVCKADYLGSCPHLAGQVMPDTGRVVTLAYSGDPTKAEARETSIVYLGAQQGAEIEKSLRDGTFDPSSFASTPMGEDLVRLKHAESLARKFGIKRKVWAYPFLPEKAADVADPVEEEQISEAEETAEEQRSPEESGAGGEDMNLKKLKQLLGLPDTTPDEEVLKMAETLAESAKGVIDAVKVKEIRQLQPLAEAGTKALDELQSEILADDLKVRGKESTELKEICELHVSKGNYSRLKEIREEKRTAVLEKFPPQAKGDSTATGVTETPESSGDKAATTHHDREYSIL